MNDLCKDFQLLFQNMELGAFLQSTDGSIIDVNPAALAILGLTREEFLEGSWTGSWSMAGEDGADDLRPAEMCLRKAAEVRDFVAPIQQENQPARVWISMNAFSMDGEAAGAPCNVLVTFKDISEVKRLEAQIRAWLPC